MVDTLADIDRRHNITPDELAAAVKVLEERQRAWQLKELRAAAGLTQAELASAMNVNQHRVSQIERGGAERSRIETLRRYAEAVGGTLSVEIAVGDHKYVIA
jgi:transcriptional regulator with XRE-family HTH domain